jgi:spermidine synthase
MNEPLAWLDEALSPHDVYRHGIVKRLAERQTPFQKLEVVESATYGKALVLDDRWQTCTGDEFLYHEPLVHLACCLHGKPERILIAGGADGGAAREALKWNCVQQVTIADIDGDVVNACRELLPEIHQGSLDDPRTTVAIGDAFELVKLHPAQWDVIIADLTDPVEAGPAYPLFTQEFYQACQSALRPGGVFVNQAGCASPPFAQQLIRVAATIRSVFPSIRIIPVNVPTYIAPWGLVLATDRLTPQFPDPREIDSLLAISGVTNLRMFDGQTCVGLLQTPKHLRQALETESRIYTLANPVSVECR